MKRIAPAPITEKRLRVVVGRRAVRDGTAVRFGAGQKGLGLGFRRRTAFKQSTLVRDLIWWIFRASHFSATWRSTSPALLGGGPWSLRVIWQESTTRRACAFLGGLHGLALDHLRQGAIIVSFIILLFLTCCCDGKRIGGRHQVAWAIVVWRWRYAPIHIYIIL
jgi:hypothetical protein